MSMTVPMLLLLKNVERVTRTSLIAILESANVDPAEDILEASSRPLKYNKKWESLVEEMAHNASFLVKTSSLNCLTLFRHREVECAFAKPK